MKMQSFGKNGFGNKSSFEEYDVEEDDNDEDDDDDEVEIKNERIFNIPLPEEKEELKIEDNNSKNINGQESVVSYAEKMKIPISNQVILSNYSLHICFCCLHNNSHIYKIDIIGHSKAVSSISVEPSGNRFVTGSLDYNCKLYDFSGMDNRHRPFFSLDADEEHQYPVAAIAHSFSGDKFVVCSGSVQPMVYDRDANELIKFVRGDMYIRDLTNTKGHTMEVTGCHFHPSDKNVLMTSGLDGAVRIWDLLGEAAFGQLMNKSVLKIRGVTGQNRVGATSCCYSPNGLKLVGGAADGSIHIWNNKKIFSSKADLILRHAALANKSVTCVTISYDNSTLAARHDGGFIALWDLSKPKAPPFKIIDSVHNSYPSANV